MKAILFFVVFVGIWFMLQVYVLPRLGIST